MKIQHECRIPRAELPLGVSRVEKRWKCPECGQHWTVVHYGNGSGSAQRTLQSGIKHWLWQRKKRKEIRNGA